MNYTKLIHNYSLYIAHNKDVHNQPTMWFSWKCKLSIEAYGDLPT